MRPELAELRALIERPEEVAGEHATAAAIRAALASSPAPGEDPAARDERCMAAAALLARGGTGGTYPNPCVGAVVVQDGRIVGVGHSAPTGGPHAEVNALLQAGPRARGATVYITLEPCSHQGRTPPCTDALIAAGVAEVAFGVQDPAGHAAGRGRALLEAAGIRVREGVCLALCAAVHEHYLHHERCRRPFITLKAATSLDGRIAASGGDSKWITGEPARRVGHWLRARHHAIAVGADTVLRDDPRLDVRLVRGVDPLPVIVDSHLRTAEASPWRQALRPGAIVLHTEHAPEDRRRRLLDAGVQLVTVEADERGRVAIVHALAALGRLPIRSMLVEGGGHLLASFVAAAAWERWYWFQAPRLLGDGAPVLPGLSWPSVAQSPRLWIELRSRVGGDDLLVLQPESPAP
jgi:diaminohydroxyphosphoribosylaminopyrimidine deaminase/5-amino-6-(5-phosphoribosylamino)uracil reductase